MDLVQKSKYHGKLALRNEETRAFPKCILFLPHRLVTSYGTYDVVKKGYTSETCGFLHFYEDFFISTKHPAQIYEDSAKNNRTQHQLVVYQNELYYYVIGHSIIVKDITTMSAYF